MAKTVVVIGASRDRRKFGNKAVRAFLARGYTVIPVNPSEREIEGLRAYRSVLEIPGPVDMATIYLRRDDGLRVMPEIAIKGIREVWLNPGADDQAVIEAAYAAALAPIVACSIRGIGEDPGRY
jgi:predicted CoA-binding protein